MGLDWRTSLWQVEEKAEWKDIARRGGLDLARRWDIVWMDKDEERSHYSKREVSRGMGTREERQGERRRGKGAGRMKYEEQQEMKEYPKMRFLERRKQSHGLTGS